MALSGKRTYVGFGFGAIQAGLFLQEAHRSGNFGRLVVAEVVPEVVATLRDAGGVYAVNVAHDDRIEAVEVGPVEVFDPSVAADREELVIAIAAAEEIGTAVPSVTFYTGDSAASLDRVLADGLRRKAVTSGPRAVVYAAENHNDAASILRGRVAAALGVDAGFALERVRFLDTVIGKMSGLITSASEIEALGLRAIARGDDRAFLVEAFNRILVSRVGFPGEFQRGIDVFEEKPDLLPFEEAKLYGHNATHALAAYVGAVRGLERIAEVRELPGAMAFLRGAFIEESGAPLVEKHAGVDELFTWNGYRRYADDLLRRMTNPFLRDTVERVGRDPARKLGWSDRLVGTMRLAHSTGIAPRRYALGAAAALARIDAAILESAAPAEAAGSALGAIWKDDGPPADDQRDIVGLVAAGLRRLQRWRSSGFGDLELLFCVDE